MRRPTLANDTRESGTRHPERPILFACGSVGLLFALLAVLERVGVDARVLGALAVALPLVAAAVLALLGRTIDRLPFVVDGERGGTLAGGLALAAEWMGVWLVPAIVLAPATGTVPALGSALGLVVLVLLFAGAMRRVFALSLPAFAIRRTGSAWAGLALAPTAIVAVAALGLFQLALLRALLVPFVGASADTMLLTLAGTAAFVCLLGGQRSLTLVNAFLAFFLALAMIVPALASIAGIGGLTAALPLDRGFAAALPGAGDNPAMALISLLALTLVTAVLPTHAARLASVRRGGLTQAGSWAMLAGYVTMSAAAVAFASAALAPGLTVSANGETSILSVLPALGWLGAVWAGFAMSLFTLATIVGRDLRLRVPRNPHATPWMDTGGLAIMRLSFIFAGLVAFAFVISLVEWSGTALDVTFAAFAISVVTVAAAGGLAPAMVASLVWRHVTVPGLAAGQIAATAVAVLAWTLLGAVPLALLAAGANGAALIAVSLATPRRFRPSPSLVRDIRAG